MKSVPAKVTRGVDEVSRQNLEFSRDHQVKDEFLHPTGFLCRRSDTNLHHWPTEVTLRDVLCRLCWWVCGKKRNAKMVRCETYRVNLCACHYKLYRCRTNLVEYKEKSIKKSNIITRIILTKLNTTHMINQIRRKKLWGKER